MGRCPAWPVCENAADHVTSRRIWLGYAASRGEVALRMFGALHAKRPDKWVERPGRLR